MNETIRKTCSKCFLIKDQTQDFYPNAGGWRSECKRCTIVRNVRYQKRTQAWKSRYGNDDERRSYMREYYSKNKEKYAEYRKEFKERFPNYYREYFRSKKLSK